MDPEIILLRLDTIDLTDRDLPPSAALQDPEALGIACVSSVILGSLDGRT